jgi:hypothetical protein
MHLEFKAFQNWDPPFAKFKNTKEYTFLPHQWWDQFGLVGMALGPLTWQILGQVVCASSCEQNWSYPIVHNKVRNNLNSKIAQDLVYFYIIARLFSISLKENIRKENTTRKVWCNSLDYFTVEP